MKSPFEEERLKYKPFLSHLLSAIELLAPKEGKVARSTADFNRLKTFFPRTIGRPIVHFERGEATLRQQLRVAVVFSGGQASGGHNVIAGLFDALKRLNPANRLFGIIGGPNGLIENNYLELTEGVLRDFRNTGGFDLIGSGRTKIETAEQLAASLKNVQALNLDGFVVIGGDDSNTNSAHLAEFFLAQGCPTKVVGVPKTIDGDLKNEWIEASFGFDTACKTYSELIGNIARDALSANKYYHFVKLMGRSASHIALECALQTHPNLTLIGEEVAEKKKKLQDITFEIVELIIKRERLGLHHGVILIPEGLIEFIPEMQSLFKELVRGSEENLSPEAKKIFQFLPKSIQDGILLDRDPHGNVQVSHIATEQLIIHAVKEELKKREPNLKFHPVSHFFGYEGRAGFPSNFDANYCYALGATAAALINTGLTGYMSAIKELARPITEWVPYGIPITMMMDFEERKGKQVPVIKKALVDLNEEPYLTFKNEENGWRTKDSYIYPGPISYFGPPSIVEATTLTLQLEQEKSLKV